MQSKFSKFKKGFSLLEILIAIAIMIFMTAVALLGIQNKDKAQREVDAASRQVAADLRSLQNDALNGKKIDSNIACSSVFIAIGGTPSYRGIYQTCAPLTYFGAKDITLKKATIAVANPGSQIVFSVPSGKVSGSGDYAAGNKEITIQSTRDTNIKNTICVDANSGNVTEKKGDQTCL